MHRTLLRQMLSLFFPVWFLSGVFALPGQTRLFHLEGKSVKLPLFPSVRWGGDVNGDGISDLCYQQRIRGEPYSDQIRIFSCADGSYLWKQESYPGWEKDQQASSRNTLFPSGVGDADGDGRGDLVYLLGDFSQGKTRVYLVLRSGRTRKILYQVFVSPWFSPLATVKVLQVIGDVDGDGVKDVLLSVGSENYQYGVALASGKTGKKIRFHTGGPLISSYFGVEMRGTPDMDRDGVPDYLISSPGYGGVFRHRFQPGWGKVWLYSGKTGKAICTFEIGASYRGLYFGGTTSVLGDLDGDGWPDIGIVDGAYSYGRIWVFSGKEAAKGKATKLFILSGMFQGEWFGSRLAPLGDWDGDGRDDVAIYASTRKSTYPKKKGEGLVYLFSGKGLPQRKPIKVLEGRGIKEEGFGGYILNIGDVDGDGVAELLVSSTYDPWTQTKPDYFEIWTHKNLALRSDRHQVSLSGKGSRTQTLSLDAGTKNAGKYYLLLGSLSGTKPGFGVGKWNLPLKPDAYFAWTASQGPNSLFLRSSFGVLDAKGQAKVRFVLPPGIPGSLLWLRFWHAFVALDSNGVSMVSNAVPLLWDR